MKLKEPLNFLSNKYGKHSPQYLVLKNLPSPCLQWLKENEDCWFIIAMEKLKVFDIDYLLIKVPQVNDVGGENW